MISMSLKIGLMLVELELVALRGADDTLSTVWTRK
jgi:hypothetical protein